MGPRGHRGYQGDTGLPGARGAPGKNGLRGFPGVPGLTGKPGRDGINGAQGIQGQAPPSLIPPLCGSLVINTHSFYRTGPIGLPGRRGRPGYDGRPGLRGIMGRPGSPGIRGPEGPEGPRGTNGAPGAPGLNAPPAPVEYYYNGQCVCFCPSTLLRPICRAATAFNLAAQVLHFHAPCKRRSRRRLKRRRHPSRWRAGRFSLWSQNRCVCAGRIVIQQRFSCRIVCRLHPQHHCKFT
jgi:hypothetical protein